MKRRFMVYLIPDIDRFQLADNELEEEFKNLKGIRKRLAPNFNTFKEKYLSLKMVLTIWQLN